MNFTALGFSFIGMILWTLAEYWLHRGLGHKKNKKNPFTVEHLQHHRDTNYFAKTSKKIWIATAVLGISTPLLSLFSSWFIGFYTALGFTVMYLIYEILHRRAHTHPPFGFYGRWLRKHHFHHHFKNPRVNHGVTSPIWDLVFGTLEIPDRVRVPRKMILAWMVDHQTGGIRKELQVDYELRKGKTAAL
ncbi:MAG: sterol desaturase family protein [Myxococcota bacterium]|nr:sterol desaturase family protein [Myxococcota bacterium]